MSFKDFFSRRPAPRNMTTEELQRQLVKNTLSGVSINASSSLNIVAVYACIRVLSESLAQLPIHIYRRRKDGRGKDSASDHPLYALLHDSGSPNDWQTAYEFKELLQGHTALRGNGYAYISKDSKGQALELLPLNPDRVSVAQDADFKVSYTVTDKNGGQRKTIPATEIFHLRGVGSDGIRGLSPIQLGREALGIARAAETHGAKFLGNFAQPSGILTTAEALKPGQMEKIRESWNAAFGGDNAFKTAVLDGNMSWSKMTMTNEEAQYLETRKFQTTEIARLFRVPPHMIADLERATFSNIEEQSLEFVVYTLMPWIKRWEGVINKQLLTPKDRADGIFAEFKVDALLRGDYETRIKGYQMMVNMGAFSPNDVLAKENENPREGGDIYLTPTNMTTNPDTTSGAPQKKPQEKAA